MGRQECADCPGMRGGQARIRDAALPRCPLLVDAPVSLFENHRSELTQKLAPDEPEMRAGRGMEAAIQARFLSRGRQILGSV